MATVVDETNPAGIQFDDAGPGAGTSEVTAKLSAPVAAKVAAVAAKAKKTPGVKPGPKPKAAVPAVQAPISRKTWGYATIERYKAQEQLQALENAGRTIFAIVPSVSTQNAYDIFYY
jgi:hypothetical protein